MQVITLTIDKNMPPPTLFLVGWWKLGHQGDREKLFCTTASEVMRLSAFIFRGDTSVGMCCEEKTSHT